MKRIKTKKNQKTISIAEVCMLASKYFVVLANEFSNNVEIEVEDFDSNVAECIDNIINSLSDENIYKEADQKTIKKIIKDNYILVDLWSKVCLSEAVMDDGWSSSLVCGGGDCPY